MSTIDTFGCTIGSGRLDRDGYRFQGRSRAHIVAWVDRFGPVPADRELDHLCRNRACASWWHLELVTRSENELRKAWRRRARATMCPHGGHDLKLYGVVAPQGGIVCRLCNREHGGVG
jgi:hypothetical protein